MSWTDELYKIYEYNSGREFDEGEPVMLPVAHSKIDVHLELTVSEDGEFQDVKPVPKEDRATIRPNTGEAKVGKTPPPFPLTESLKYLGRDLGMFLPKSTDKKVFSDNKSFYDAYIELMQKWEKNKYTHKAVSAVLSYVSKGTIVSDCIRAGVLEVDENNLLKSKQYSVDADRVTVRFIVHYNNLSLESKTWKDKSLYDSFLRFISESRGDEQLCYALGKVLPAQYIHPKQIIKGAVNAKIISSNDESGFSYRGRFRDKKDALSVSYEFSEKMHNALKWLIDKQSLTFGKMKNIDSLTVIVWASAMQKIPSFEKSAWDDEDEEEIPSTYPYYAEMLEKRIFSIGRQLEPDTKVMIMGLDAATPGRINISMYSEIESSRYLENIEKWHKETAWLRYSSKQKKSGINSFSLYDIVKYAFGTEQGAFVDCDKKIMRDNIIRLINCVTNGAKLPEDIMNSLCRKASNPLAYENGYNHRSVLETACGMIRKNYTDHKKGVVSMAFDPNNHDRSYLFGCLLAIADKAESDTYDVNEKRVTNARRLWSAFSSRPYQTWKIIEERLEPYLEKENSLMTRYTKLINEVMAKFTPEGFADNSKLSPLYLIGYHHYNALLWTKKEDKNEEEK